MTTSGGTANARNGLSRLVAAASILTVVWLVLLPWLAKRPAVASHLRAMEEGEVNAAAMVYTELDRLPLRPAWVDRHLVLWPRAD